ncbi:DAK2 domain-containing protein, partial [Angustibacter aerolatus]
SAVRRTPRQLAALASAGVVDAGGSGLVVVLEALRDVVRGDPAPEPDPVERADPETPEATGGPHAPAVGYAGPGTEVMFLLDADEPAVAALRARLAELGDAVVVVGGDGLWNVHVHTDDVDAVLAAGEAAGRPHEVRVTTLVPAGEGSVRESADPTPEPLDGQLDGVTGPAGPTGPSALGLVAVADGAGQALLLERCGAVVVRRDDGPPTAAELLDAVEAAAGSAPVAALLPGERSAFAAAGEAGRVARSHGLTVVVLTTHAPVQVLAALAVLDPEATASEALVRMSAAAAATRYASVLRPAPDAATGRLGGDAGAVVHGSDPCEVSVEVAERLLADGGELLTLVTGADDDASRAAEMVRARVAEGRPDVEVHVVDGGQPSSVLLLGVE